MLQNETLEQLRTLWQEGETHDATLAHADARSGQISVPVSALRTLAEARLFSFGLNHLVRLESIEASTWLSTYETSPIDFIFLDADRADHQALWPQICRVLRPGGFRVWTMPYACV